MSERDCNECPTYDMGADYGDFCAAGKLGLRPRDCHLTPDSFPRLRAEIAGEWSCEKCKGYFECQAIEKQYMVRMDPCKAWQPKDMGDSEERSDG